MIRYHQLKEIVPDEDDKFLFDTNLLWWGSISDRISDFFDTKTLEYQFVYNLFVIENVFSQSLVDEYSDRYLNPVFYKYLDNSGKLNKDNQNKLGNIILFHKSLSWLTYLKNYSEILYNSDINFNYLKERNIENDETDTNNSENSEFNSNNKNLTKIYGFNSFEGQNNSENTINQENTETQVQTKKINRRLNNDVTRIVNGSPIILAQQNIKTFNELNLIQNIVSDTANIIFLNIL